MKSLNCLNSFISCARSFRRTPAPSRPIEIELTTFRVEERLLPTPSLEGRVSERPVSPNIEEDPLGESFDERRENELFQYLLHLIFREVKQPSGYVEGAELEKYRNCLAESMAIKREKLQFSKPALYTAVAIQDFVLNSLDPPNQRYELVSLACLSIAIKSEEEGGGFSFCKKIQSYAEKLLSEKSLFEMEWKILELLDWKVWRATPIHFLNAFYKCSFLFDEDRIRARVVPKNRFNPHIYKYAEFFCDFCQGENKFVKYAPSLLAASAILCARRVLEVSPLWNSRLERFTTYSEEELRECTDDILREYKREFPNHTSLVAT